MNVKIKNTCYNAIVKILIAGLFAVCTIFLQKSALAVPNWNVQYSQNTDGSTDHAEQRSIENLRAFAKLYGYVKYFHPSDEASAIDWERFAVYGSENVMHAESQEDLKQKLSVLFRPIAPTVQIYSTSDQPPEPAAGTRHNSGCV